MRFIDVRVSYIHIFCCELQQFCCSYYFALTLTLLDSVKMVYVYDISTSYHVIFRIHLMKRIIMVSFLVIVLTRFTLALHTTLKSGSFYRLYRINRAGARTLIGGGGGCIFINSCSARLISFEISCYSSYFKRNYLDRTRIYEYTPPPPKKRSIAGPAYKGSTHVKISHLVDKLLGDQVKLVASSVNTSW